MNDLIGTIEAAAIIGVERSTLTRWLDAGRIVLALKLPGPNGAHLFERAEVERVAADFAPERAVLQLQRDRRTRLQLGRRTRETEGVA